MSASSKVALIMGVANQRSIAWSCAEQFSRLGWNVILTTQSEKTLLKAQPLIDNHQNILGGFVCDVLTDLDKDSGSSSSIFRQRLSDILNGASLDAVVHSLAYAPSIKTTPLLQTTRDDFLVAQEISAYSLISVARETLEFFQQQPHASAGTSSITALTYLGATRAIPGYHAMGPAKASLESIVRGLALELADVGCDETSRRRIRVNAVSAGPLPTISAKGGISGFDQMRQDVELRAPLGNITSDQVASTVQFLSSNEASGITGQTIHVDGGYSIVGGPGLPSRLQA
jgi:enoyl-[acyl-carrier protein] reductase I